LVGKYDETNDIKGRDKTKVVLLFCKEVEEVVAVTRTDIVVVLVVGGW